MSNYTLHCGDSIEYMATMPDDSVDLIATDPPYHKVKDEAWDRQHKTAGEFLAWLDTALAQFARILKPNGSLYLFASPRMAARVEVMVGERFNVLNHIVWAKHDGSGYGTGGHSKVCKEELRSYFPQTERIIFAEHYGADNIAKGEAGYAAKCDELRGFVFEPLRAYLDGEREKLGLSSAPFDKVLGTNALAKKYFNVCQWQLPTHHGYTVFQESFPGHFQRPYEELRTEYEELRRPFAVSADVPYTDVWTFPTVQAYAGKHSCQKPVEMLEHIVTASSRPGAVVFDPFMGSGTTAVAAIKHGRSFIGCDLSERWVRRTEQRIQAEAYTHQPSLLEVA